MGKFMGKITQPSAKAFGEVSPLWPPSLKYKVRRGPAWAKEPRGHPQLLTFGNLFNMAQWKISLQMWEATPQFWNLAGMLVPSILLILGMILCDL